MTAQHTVHVNRAPVLTLRAAVVAERLGYDPAASLPLGKAVAGLKPNPRAGAWASTGPRLGSRGVSWLCRWPGAAAGSRLISGAGAIPEGQDPPHHRTRGRHGQPRSAG
jgi:hypothetical protein